MDKSINKIIKIISIIFIAFAGLFQILVLVKGDEGSTNVLNPYMYEAYIALILCAIAAIIFPIIHIIKNPHDLVKFSILLGVIVVFGLISYLLSANNLSLEFLQSKNTSLGIERIVGSALIFTYITGALAVLAIIYSSISNMLK